MPDSLYDKIANELNFRALFDICPVGFSLNRLSNGEFLQGNKALFDIVGYSKDEFMRLSYWDITPQKYAAEEQAALEQLKSKGAYGPYHKEYIHKKATSCLSCCKASKPPIRMARSTSFLWSKT